MGIYYNNKLGISKIIESNILNSKLTNSFTFRSQSYDTTLIKLRIDTKGDDIYIDTEYSITFFNKSQLLSDILEIYITQISILLKIRGIGTLKYKILE